MMRDMARKYKDEPRVENLGIGPRVGLVVIAIIMYCLTLLNFIQRYRDILLPGPFRQVLVVYYVAITLSIVIFIPVMLIINLTILGSLGSILFIAMTIGPDLSLLIPLQIPIFIAATLQLPQSYCLFWLVFINSTLFMALRSHSAWGFPVEGADFYQVLLYVFVSIIISTIFFLLKQKNIRIRNLMIAQERLDRAYQKVVDANLDFQTYALFAREEAIEKERRRLAGELHDIIGYSLTNVIMLIQAAQIGKGDSEQTHAILEKARLHADESLRDARQALAILRSERTDRPRGANLFLKLTRTFQDVTGITITIDFANMPSLLPIETEKILYRIIQEGLTNAFRHGKATEIAISFWYVDREITVRIRDNGRGDTSEIHQSEQNGLERPGIGLAGLREQVEQFGGQFKAGPVSGGFVLEATLPLQDNIQEVNDGG